MIVVDTSAWIEYLRATESSADLLLTDALEQDRVLGVPDVVRLELLAGVRESGVAGVTTLLARAVPLPAAPGDSDVAASLYRRAREQGRTVRSLVDCLVAATALRADAPLLAQDRDFAVLATVSDLQLH